MEYYKEANRFLRKYGSDAFKVIAAYEEQRTFRRRNGMPIGTAITVFLSRLTTQK